MGRSGAVSSNSLMNATTHIDPAHIATRLAAHGGRSGLVSAATLLAALLGGCGDTARLPVESGMGPRPVLPEPDKSIIPTVNIAPARGWAEGASPVAASGTV